MIKRAKLRARLKRLWEATLDGAFAIGFLIGFAFGAIFIYILMGIN